MSVPGLPIRNQRREPLSQIGTGEARLVTSSKQIEAPRSDSFRREELIAAI